LSKANAQLAPDAELARKGALVASFQGPLVLGKLVGAVLPGCALKASGRLGAKRIQRSIDELVVY
jgi:hypothetical protein